MHVARHKKVKMSVAMQTAAVRSALNEGQSLEKVEQDHPDLADGIKAVRKERESTAPPPSRRGSGSTRAYSSMNRRPTL